jgi:CDP-glycerol glycerophosphotransferase (TagB/SpsB family)
MHADGRPIVLYNPHVSPHLSSWYKWGRQILDFFLAHEEYHLIFAPHVMLFERPFVLTIDRLRMDRAGHIDERYLRAPNIHIDLGSRASTNMTYTNLADIYIGDVSSQVYEFLREPRPCLFLNAHGMDHREDANYTHWRFGPVVNDLEQLEQSLQYAIHSHRDIFRPIQQTLFEYSFDLRDEPSSERAAQAVARVLVGDTEANPASLARALA